LDRSFYFFYFDFVLGSFVLGLGFMLYRVFSISYLFICCFGGMSFFRWISSSGTSFLFFIMLFGRHEVRWLEVGGGSGVYRLIYLYRGYLKSFIEGIGVGGFFLAWGFFSF